MNRSQPERACEAPWTTDEDALAQSRPAFETGVEPDPCVAQRRIKFSSNGMKIAPTGRMARWHLPRGQTLSGLCRHLTVLGVNYALLPTSAGPDSEQPALLVADDEIRRIRNLVTRVPLGQPLAIYAATDLPGFSFQQHWRHISDATNMAVLPPYLATALLANARIDERGIRTPPADDLLLWAIYGALYLAGNDHFAVGSSSDRPPILVGPPARMIGRLALDTAMKLAEPLKLEALDQHLANAGWEPPYDVLRRLACWNSWAAFKVGERDAAVAPEEPGVVAFFVRSQVFASGMQDDVTSMLQACGFELLKTIDLDAEQAEVATRASRGANWGPGGFPVGGGTPVRIIIAFDLLPTPVEEQLRANYPYLDNGRVLRAKQFCRGLVKDRLPRSRQFNPLHSTDDSRDAWRIVRLFAAEEESAFRKVIQDRKAAFTTHHEVVRDLTRIGVRAKIELIRYRSELAVKKTFRHTCLRFMEREIAFMDAVSPHRAEILPVLERGPNYFITPFVEGQPLRRRLFGLGIPKLMTLHQVANSADLLRYLFSQGYDPVDVGPHNLLVHPSGRLTAIDFEFVHKTNGPVDPEQSACLNGIPEGFEGDWPLMARWCPAQSRALTDPYGKRWYGHTGLTRQSFLHDPPSVQRLKRFVNYPTYLCAKVIERQSIWVRDRLKHGLKSRLPVLVRMVAQARRSRAIRS